MSERNPDSAATPGKQVWVLRVGQEFRVECDSADEAVAWVKQLEERVWPNHVLTDTSSCLWRDEAAEVKV